MGVRVELFSFQSFQEMEETDRNTRLSADFLSDEESNAADTPPTLQSFTQEDLDAARDSGHQEGYDSGQQAEAKKAEASNAETSRQLAELMQKATSKIARVEDDYKAFLHKQKQSTPELALAIAKKVASNAIKDNPLAEIEALVAECLTTLVDEPSVTIYTNPNIAQPLKSNLEEALSASPSMSIAISVEADESIPQEDCRVEWSNGTAERNTEKLWEGISLIINQRYVAGDSVNPTEEHCEKELSIQTEDITTESADVEEPVSKETLDTPEEQVVNISLATEEKIIDTGTDTNINTGDETSQLPKKHIVNDE